MNSEAVNNRRKKRNGNIELLRCFLMFCIVLGHVCCHGPYARTSFGLVVNTLTLFAVDAFAFVSGWFSVRTSFARMIRFLGYGVFAYLTICVIGRIADLDGGVMTMGWYGNSYFAVMLFASLINSGIDKMTEDYGRKSIVGVLMLYLGFMFLQWFPLGGRIQVFDQSQWGSHSAMLLLGMYLTGRVLKKIEIDKRLGLWISLAVFFGCECFVIAWSGLTTGHLHDLKMWDYRSPIMLVLAVSIFLVFLKVKCHSLIQRAATFIAPSMFMVHLLHDGTGRDTSSWLYSKVEIYLLEKLSLNLILVFISTAIIVFVTCVIIDLLRKLLLLYLFRCIEVGRSK